MPSVGDRVVFEGVKIGGGRRAGELVSIDGRAVRVRWEDGTESLMFPGPGAMRVVGGSEAVAATHGEQLRRAGANPRRGGGKASTQMSGTIKGSTKLGGSKRTKTAGGGIKRAAAKPTPAKKATPKKASTKAAKAKKKKR